MKDNGIKQIFSVPYHPSSNSLAERAVLTVKQGLRQMQGSETIQDTLPPIIKQFNREGGADSKTRTLPDAGIWNYPRQTFQILV